MANYLDRESSCLECPKIWLPGLPHKPLLFPLIITSLDNLGYHDLGHLQINHCKPFLNHDEPWIIHINQHYCNRYFPVGNVQCHKPSPSHHHFWQYPSFLYSKPPPYLSIFPYFHVGKTIINHPQCHHFYRWYVYHSQINGWSESPQDHELLELRQTSALQRGPTGYPWGISWVTPNVVDSNEIWSVLNSNGIWTLMNFNKQSLDSLDSIYFRYWTKI